MYMKNVFLISTLVFFALTIVSAAPKKNEGLYTSSITNVMLLGKRNFDSQITNARQKGVSIVHYFRNRGNAN